ncbi:MAG: 50S ribosomal protein L29 [Chloroflexota bacterium]
MASIVELRQMSNDKLTDMLENSREEMFNLRFQKASARLENTARLSEVRHEIAQLETVLHMRELAIEAAIEDPATVEALADEEWRANARFVYEDSAWRVDFTDKAGKGLITTYVDLNKSRPKGRRARRTKKQPQLVVGREERA